jgi:hypothetical protein
MIRIDEIYNNTFWPWIKQKRPGTRMFYCDPPGHTQPEHLFNHGSNDPCENDYIYFHDQEPVDLDLYQALFDRVVEKGTGGIGWQLTDDKWVKLFDLPKQIGHVVVSEQGEYVDRLCKQYGWTAHYYFYHAWACQDWFRGYDKSFLIDRARTRQPTKTFLCPNRIIGGLRDHRVLFLYHLFRMGLDHNHISAPKICPVENVDILTIAQRYYNTYPDILQVLTQTNLPMLFSGETTQQMSSYHLTNFDEAADSLVYVPTETVFFGRRLHLTEKTFKAIALEMPFVLLAPAGSLAYLREYGFKTFDHVFDESYDLEVDDLKRIEKVAKLLKSLDNLTPAERLDIHRACVDVVEHNYQHFYHGGLSQHLWAELTGMLNNLKSLQT